MSGDLAHKPKATDPPKCKICGIAHRGTCADHSARGAIADQAPQAGVRPLRVASKGSGSRVAVTSAVTSSAPGVAATRTSTPTLEEIKDATDALERAFPTPEISPSSSGRTSAFGAENLGSSPSGEAKRAGAGPSNRKRVPKAALSVARKSTRAKAPALPVSTIVTSPRGISARVHGDKPLDAKGREVIGKVIDTAAAALAKSTKRRRAIAVAPTLKELRKMADDASQRIADKPKRGRPKTGFDKKAYDREKARERRAAKKAGK